MAESKTTDELLAAEVRSKIEALNAAVRAANGSGLYVNFGIRSHSTEPRHSEVGEATIERPGDYHSGLRSVKL
jgi:hypothetical protein